MQAYVKPDDAKAGLHGVCAHCYGSACTLHDEGIPWPQARLLVIQEREDAAAALAAHGTPPFHPAYFTLPVSPCLCTFTLLVYVYSACVHSPCLCTFTLLVVHSPCLCTFTLLHCHAAYLCLTDTHFSMVCRLVALHIHPACDPHSTLFE